MAEPRPYEIFRSTADGPRHIVWTARTKDQQVYGTLIIGGKSFEIEWVNTDPKFRRKGIATALLAAARADGYAVVHSQHRTPDGELWARSTGDPIPCNAMFAKAV